MRNPTRDEALRWLTHALDEFGDADDLRERGRFYLALFHFQQAAEKALKAFLYTHLKSAQVFYTHSVGELLKMASEIDSDFQELQNVKKLDRYYIPTRYPNGLPGGVPSRHFDDPDEALDAMKMAKGVLDLAKKKLE